MLDDLYRPLGLDIAPVRRAPRLTATRVGGFLALALVLAGSAATSRFQPALREASFSAPEPHPVTVVAAKPLPAPQGPTVIHGPPLRAPSPTLPATPDIDPSPRQLLVHDPASLRQPPAIAHLPDDALIENSPFGPLPIRAADGRRPLDVYAGASSGSLGTRIAIVVGGLGISQTGTQDAIRALPAAVTLAFAPAGNSLARWMQAARRGGHELILQAPLEPFGYPNVSPGPHTLEVADAAAGKLDALDWTLGRMTNYVGVMNYMGARFTADPQAMKALLSDLGRRGLLYLDDSSSSRSLAKDVAKEDGVAFAAADVMLDRSRDAQDIRKQLDTLERVARAQGSAIGVASAFDVSVEAIREWIPEARKRGIEIVPVSALAFDPEAQ